MAVTIADLEINIQSTGNEMIATFTKLATKLNALSAHLDKATSSMKKVSKAMGDTGKEAKKAGEGAEKGAKGLGSFANSILRIMKYRAIRAVLKTITQGFREGVQNIALYSAAINEMDATKANNVMSAYASMGAQIKNSLGAAVMPLLAQVMPMIQKVADMFMDAAEAVAKFFATLNGQTTYTAANREYWVDYAKGLQKSTGAAKELKRTILGFDEINALNSQSSGGSGSNTPNYKDMFVEKTNDWFGLKDTFEWVLTAVKAIGAAIAAWKIGSAFSKSLSGALTTSKALGTVLGGLAAIGIGIYISWSGGASFAEGDIKDGIVKAVTGALSGALGGAMLGSYAGTGGMVVGALIGVGISLVSTLISFFTNKAKIAKQEYWDSVVAPFMQEMGFSAYQYTNDAISARMDANIELRNKIAEVSTEVDPEVLAKLSYARSLIADIFTLDEKEIKTASEIEEIKFKIEALNELNLDGIHLEWSELEGVVGGTREEMEKTIDQMLEMAKTQAKIDALKKAYENVFEAQTKWTDSVRRMRELEAGMTEAARRGNNKLFEQLREQWGWEQQAAFEAKKTLYDAQNSYIGVMRAVGETGEIVRSEIVPLADDVKDAYSNALFGAVIEASDAANKISGSFNKAKNDIKNALDPKNIIKPGAWADALKSAVSNLPSINFTVSGSNLIPRVQTKASGGFVPSGDLFVAGEAGAELIMAAPNGSEVVNMAQFEAAMVNAVSMAGGNGGDWTIVVQDGNGAERSRQVITAAERANRRDGRTIIPVGVY